jgi:hypothetical protein
LHNFRIKTVSAHDPAFISVSVFHGNL